MGVFFKSGSLFSFKWEFVFENGSLFFESGSFFRKRKFISKMEVCALKMEVPCFENKSFFGSESFYEK